MITRYSRSFSIRQSHQRSIQKKLACHHSIRPLGTCHDCRHQDKRCRKVLRSQRPVYRRLHTAVEEVECFRSSRRFPALQQVQSLSPDKFLHTQHCYSSSTSFENLAFAKLLILDRAAPVEHLAQSVDVVVVVTGYSHASTAACSWLVMYSSTIKEPYMGSSKADPQNKDIFAPVPQRVCRSNLFYDACALYSLTSGCIQYIRCASTHVEHSCISE